MDDIDPGILPIVTKEGVGGVCTLSIEMILADTSAPKTRSLVVTESVPDGISVEINSVDLTAEWSQRMETLRILAAIELDEDDISWEEAAGE